MFKITLVTVLLAASYLNDVQCMDDLFDMDEAAFGFNDNLMDDNDLPGDGILDNSRFGSNGNLFGFSGNRAFKSDASRLGGPFDRLIGPFGMRGMDGYGSDLFAPKGKQTYTSHSSSSKMSAGDGAEDAEVVESETKCDEKGNCRTVTITEKSKKK